MENLTMVTPLKMPIVFEMEGFQVAEGQGSLLFFLTLLNYLTVVLGNGLMVGGIMCDRALHRPMYVMVCNLAVCDVLGASTVLIRLMINFLTGDKRIPYNTAISQAFSVHVYGAAVQTILSAMAYDRYLAVCEPLRYHAIMTPPRLVFSCVLPWLVAVLLIGVLFALNVGTPLCGNIINHVYCSNRTILRNACAPTPTNNIYGLSMTWCLSTSTFLVIAFSYIKILQACVRHSTDSASRSKALQTCATHLVIYIFYELTTVVIIMSQRFSSASPNAKKFCGILFVSIPPVINPIIYGLVTKELRLSLIKQLTKRIMLKQTSTVKTIN